MVIGVLILERSSSGVPDRTTNLGLYALILADLLAKGTNKDAPAGEQASWSKPWTEEKFVDEKTAMSLFGSRLTGRLFCGALLVLDRDSGITGGVSTSLP